LLSSMSVEGMGPSLAVDGSTTKEVFEAYAEQVLVPALRPGQVVVMDNLAAHKGERIKELIEERDCELLFLPPTRPISTLSRKRSRRSRASCGGPRPVPARRSWRP
jgi:transposase